MAYTPKTWQCGEPIMADDLNHMEQGIAQGSSVAPLFVHELQMTAEEIAEAGITGVTVGNAYRLDTPTATIKQALQSGRAVWFAEERGDAFGVVALMSFSTNIIPSTNLGMFANNGSTWSSPSSYPYLVHTYGGSENEQ